MTRFKCNDPDCLFEDENGDLIEYREVKGSYIIGQYDELVAFECTNCKAAMTIVIDPVKEQPNYCFHCGVKLDWNGIYEKFFDDSYREMEENGE